MTIDRIETIITLESKYPFFNGNALNLNAATDEVMDLLEDGTPLENIILTYTMIGKMIIVGCK